MKKWALMLLALLAFTALPTAGTELGELHPVSLLLIRIDDKQVEILTDTNDRGVGETLDTAMKNLEDTTPGHLFLDTVENLILTEQTRYLIPRLKKCLRPGVTVCLAAGEIEVETLPEFLKTHKPKVRLQDAGQTTVLQKLECREERYFLEE